MTKEGFKRFKDILLDPLVPTWCAVYGICFSQYTKWFLWAILLYEVWNALYLFWYTRQSD